MTKKYRYTIILDDEERAMLNFLTNKGLYTYKTVLRLCIRGRYYSETEKLKKQGIDVQLDNYLPTEEEILESNNENQESLEDLKAQFIARRKAKKEGDSNA